MKYQFFETIVNCPVPRDSGEVYMDIERCRHIDYKIDNFLPIEKQVTCHGDLKNCPLGLSKEEATQKSI